MLRNCLVLLFFCLIVPPTIWAEDIDPDSVANLDEIQAVSYLFDLRVTNRDGRIWLEDTKLVFRFNKLKGKQPTKVLLDAYDNIYVTNAYFSSTDKPSRVEAVVPKRILDSEDLLAGLEFTIPGKFKDDRQLKLHIEFRNRNPEIDNHFALPTGISERTGTPFLLTQFEPAQTRFLFPLQDSPSAFAIFESIIVSDDGVKVWSPGSRRARRNPNTWHYETQVKIPPHIYALVVGDFNETTVDGVTVIADLSQDEVERRAPFVARHTLQSRGYFAERLGWQPDDIPLRTLLAPAAWRGFGMENHSLTFLNEEKTNPDDPDTFGIRTIAHEVAHEIFGARIGIQGWSDVTVKEATASYYGHRYLERFVSPAQAAFSWYGNLIWSEAQPFNHNRDPQGGVLSHRWPNLFERQNYKDYYNKGGWILRELEALVGQDLLDTGMGNLIRENPYRAFSTSGFYLELAEAIEAEAEKLGEEDYWRNSLGHHVFTLVELPGMPELKIVCEDFDRDGLLDGATVSVTNNEMPYILKNIPIEAFGPKGRFEIFVDPTVADEVVLVLSDRNVRSLFVDAKATRWLAVQSENCGLRGNMEVVTETVQQLQEDDVRIFAQLDVECGGAKTRKPWVSDWPKEQIQCLPTSYQTLTRHFSSDD